MVVMADMKRHNDVISFKKDMVPLSPKRPSLLLLHQLTPDRTSTSPSTSSPSSARNRRRRRRSSPPSTTSPPCSTRATATGTSRSLRCRRGARRWTARSSGSRPCAGTWRWGICIGGLFPLLLFVRWRPSLLRGSNSGWGSACWSGGWLLCLFLRMLMRWVQFPFAEISRDCAGFGGAGDEGVVAAEAGVGHSCLDRSRGLGLDRIRCLGQHS